MSNETSNGSLGQHQYQNQVFENDVSIGDTNPADVVVTVNENGINSEMKEQARLRRIEAKQLRELSLSQSVDYEDVAKAEELTEQVDIGSPRFPHVRTVTQTYRRQSNVLRLRRMSHNEMEDVEDEFFHRELILKIRKTLPLKDFRDEIRAWRDLEKFLVQPVVLLDVPHTSLDAIIDALLTRLQKDLDVDEKITAQAGKAFFTFQEQHQDSLASVDQLRETIQGVQYKPDGADYEESWITALCTLPMLKKSHVGIARLRNPLNLGNKCEEVTFVLAVIAPKKEKFTKNAVEIGRTFSSMMCNSSFRHDLINASTEDEFKGVLAKQSFRYKRQVRESLSEYPESIDEEFTDYSVLQIGHGIYDDFKRRLPHYPSDFVDGKKLKLVMAGQDVLVQVFKEASGQRLTFTNLTRKGLVSGVIGKNTIHKLISTVLFLYFACLLPDIAFGSLYEKNTNGTIDVTSCIVSQTFGGIMFAFLSGQPMQILLTTAPLALYVKVIKLVSESFELDFAAMYTMTGVWNSIFLVLQALFNLSKLMKYSTRSIEEIFGFFIALAFTADAIKATIANFSKNYNFRTLADALTDTANSSAYNITDPENCAKEYLCYRPENSILFLFLMLGTLWLGLSLLKFDQSQFLSSTKREILADYALPIAVIVFTLIGSLGFQAVKLEPFKHVPGRSLFNVPAVGQLPALAHLGAAGLGLCLSCLFFVDQNVSAAVVNAPQNKLKKGPAYHWDLMIVGLINVPLSVFNLPWVHAALPHSPLHVKALADVEQHVSNLGNVHDEIVKVRETRLTGIISHILIGLSLLFVQYLQFIPIAVLQGLFLYLGFSSFIGNQMFDRMMLVFTEGSSYPPNHYIRKVPHRTVHLFTACQLALLLVVCGFGFADQFYLKMIFPVVILLLLPVRHLLLPLIMERKYLAILDS